jgi:nucleotide-binding universal stress UspA family protein
MYRDVLVPLDGSTFSERALCYALPIARAARARVHLLLVHEPIARYAVEIAPTRMIDRWEDQQREREVRYVERRAMALRSAGVAAVAEIREGDAADELSRRAQTGVDLVVMSTHGRGGLERVWAGSVADHVMRHVRLPVLLVPPTLADRSAPPNALPLGVAEPPEIRPSHVVAATDGSPAAAEAVTHAVRLARLFGARVTLIRTVAPPRGPASPFIPHAAGLNEEVMERREAEAREFLDALAAAVTEPDTPVAVHVVRASHASRGILAACAEVGGDLLALGTHRRSRFVRAALGSVADGVVRGSPVPVLVAHLPEHSGGRAGDVAV